MLFLTSTQKLGHPKVILIFTSQHPYSYHDNQSCSKPFFSLELLSSAKYGLLVPKSTLQSICKAADLHTQHGIVYVPVPVACLCLTVLDVVLLMSNYKRSTLWTHSSMCISSLKYHHYEIKFYNFYFPCTFQHLVFYFTIIFLLLKRTHRSSSSSINISQVPTRFHRNIT